MTWGGMVADEARRRGNQATLPDAGWEAYKTARMTGRSALMSYGEQRKAWVAAVAWVTRTQQTWEDLTAVDAIWELRRGEDSIFYPLFKDDPKVWVDCPADLTHNPGARVLTDREGYCDDCGYSLIDGARAIEGDN